MAEIMEICRCPNVRPVFDSKENKYFIQCDTCGQIFSEIKPNNKFFIPGNTPLMIPVAGKNIFSIESLKENLTPKQFHEAYLKTGKWAVLRIKALTRDDYTCQGCLEKKAVQVHHITYENIGNEFCFELISLCDDCHEKIHDSDK